MMQPTWKTEQFLCTLEMVTLPTNQRKACISLKKFMKKRGHLLVPLLPMWLNSRYQQYQCCEYIMLTCCVSCTMLSWHKSVKIAEYIKAADSIHVSHNPQYCVHRCIIISMQSKYTLFSFSIKITRIVLYALHLLNMY